MNRRIGFGVLLVLAVLVAAYLSAARRTGGPPLDPASTGLDGARGVVELIDRFGDMAVVDGVPGPETDTALVLQDRFDRDAEQALRRWVRAGGTLVVADAGSTFLPSVGRTVEGSVDVACDVEGLEGVRRLDVGRTLLLDAPAGASTCSVPGGRAVVVAERVGDGRLVALGGPAPFTNDLLDEADNAALATGLLLPDDGARIAFLRPSLAVGSGEDGLVDLIGTPVWAALAQLVVAFLLAALWRARRLGRPIAEPQPVQIDASELTGAVGRILARASQPARAAAVLRDRTRRQVSGPLGLALDAPAERVVDTIAARTSLTVDEARRAATAPVTADDELVEVAALLFRIRDECTQGENTR